MPSADITPVQALLILIAYEKWTGEDLKQEDIESGKIKLCDILTQEDFDNARKVSISSSIFPLNSLKFSSHLLT